jgi:hypothetical protein
MNRHWSWFIIAIILLSAFTVRGLGIRYGLPRVFYPDEAAIVNHAVAFGTGDLNPHFFNYPSLYMYVLFVIYGVTYVLGAVAGAFQSTADFARLFFTDSTLFYLPGRAIALLCGGGSVWLVYALGRRVYSEGAGLAAAALLSFSPLHVSFSSVIKIEVPAGFLATASLYFCWMAYNSGTVRHFVLAGALAGLAASTMYPAGFVVIALIVAQVLRWRSNHDPVPIVDRKLVFAGTASGLAFVLGTPFAVLDWRAFLAELTNVGGLYSDGIIWVQSPLFPFTSLVDSMGFPVGLVALSGMACALLRRRPGDLIVASYPLFLGCFFMLFATKELHHMLIAFPALSILGGALVDEGVGFVVRAQKWSRPAVAVLTLAIVVLPARSAFAHQYRLTLPDTRVLAKGWIETNIPYGSTVVMDGGKYYLESFSAPIQVSPDTIQAALAGLEGRSNSMLEKRIGTRRTGYTRESEYFRQMLQAIGDRPGYSVVRITHDDGSDRADVLTLDEYLSQGAAYAVTSSYAWEKYLPGGQQALQFPVKTARYATLYRSLDERATLLKQFSPSDRLAGPTLRIYRLPPPDGSQARGLEEARGPMPHPARQ